ncbi:hypothetical protein SSX86_023643 [Deinandra increscens subsp. villosa]|uniref:Peptidase C1A papain C-terminal domain-containing protein n=1 Tax=Deinandra increscens subsp. villosa TaxID=3103831 RepID=A0AAP0GTR0_9ASTR
MDQGLPDTVDWRDTGAVGPVQDQDGTNTCWAFASVVCVEAMNFQATGVFTKLSEQQLIDGAVDTKCLKGGVTKAFDFIIKNRGLASQKDYPWTGVLVYGAIDDHACIHRNREFELKRAVAKHPVTVLIDSLNPSFLKYERGIYRQPIRGDLLNHVMAVVGYGATKHGEEYWICKNSWGSNWGEGGYIRIKRNIKEVQEKCVNLAYEANYAIRDDIAPPFKRPFQPLITYGQCRCIICRPELHEKNKPCKCSLCRPPDLYYR